MRTLRNILANQVNGGTHGRAGFESENIYIYLPSLHGGGAERIMVTLANGFADRGHKVDLVLAKAEGPYMADVKDSVRVVDRGASRVIRSLPELVRYLGRERTATLLSVLSHANVTAVAAHRLANPRARRTPYDPGRGRVAWRTGGVGQDA